MTDEQRIADPKDTAPRDLEEGEIQAERGTNEDQAARDDPPLAGAARADLQGEQSRETPKASSLLPELLQKMSATLDALLESAERQNRTNRTITNELRSIGEEVRARPLEPGLFRKPAARIDPVALNFTTPKGSSSRPRHQNPSTAANDGRSALLAQARREKVYYHRAVKSRKLCHRRHRAICVFCDRPSTEGSEQLEDSLGFAQRSRLLTATCRESESFPWGSLVPRTTGSGKPPTLTTATTSPAEPTTAPASATPTTAPASVRPTTAPASAKLTTVPASGRPTTVPPSESCDTSSAKKTTNTAKGSRLPFVAKTEVVARPALPAPLSSDYDAKRAAKGKGHEGDDRKRSSDRDNVIDVDQVSKKSRARFASPPRRVSRSVFQDKASASSLFFTLVFHDDVVTPINTESSGDMMRQGLKFRALVNKVGHELEAKVEVLKENLEDETHRTENARTAAEARKSAEALLTEAERSTIALAAAEEREQCSAAIVTKRDGELATILEKLRKADGHIQSLERKFTRAKDKFVELLVDDQEPPKLEEELTFLTAEVAEHAGDEERFERLMTSLHGLLHVLDPKVSGVLSSIPRICGVGAEVTKSRIDDLTEGDGTVGAPEEMRTDEDSQGPRIDVLTEDPRLDDVFGETEAVGVPVTHVAPPGVDEETVP
ncbi:hypothetical protein AALP_AA5G008300 [Arabis alpina]|uniref:Uncharacterized protein n=1 Tax=Arabis alpina TaxID=50452 RepID=A0A087GU52_ARAAL|nr:hypothetical protein AALP_AA5G008300 [Arabis alpina]